MDFVNVLDVGVAGVAEIVSLARDLKANPTLGTDSLAGSRVGLFFQKPSMRTRVSCEVGTAQLGAQPIVLKNDEVGLGTREAPQDVARVLDRYLDVLAFRVFDHRDLEVMAEHAKVPVINLLSDLEHPCQAIADLLTVAEHRPLRGASLAYVGDGNNVANSLMMAATATGASVTVASPPGYEPGESMVARARQVATNGATVTVTNDPHRAVQGADIVYTDVWVSMGDEGEAEERQQLFVPFRVTRTLFEEADSEAIFMHCLPAHRGEEVADEMMEHDRSRVFDQAENRLHAFKAILLHLTNS